MDRLKQSTDVKVRVRLYDSGGAPKTGVAYTAVSITAQKYAGGSYTKTVGSGDWHEIDPSGMPGNYDLVMTSSDTDTLGDWNAELSATGTTGASLEFEIVPQSPQDVKNSLDAIVAEVDKKQQLVYTWTVFTFDSQGRQILAVKQIYDTNDNAMAHDGVTGLLATETVATTYPDATHVNRLQTKG